MPFAVLLKDTVSPHAVWGWLLWLAACSSPFAGPSTATFTATAAITVAFALVAALALAGRARLDAAFSGDARPIRVAVRARTARTAFLPQRDPDASGRPRPRAPGH